MQIINGLVYSDTFKFEPHNLLITGQFFDSYIHLNPIANPNDDLIIDATNCLVIPGLIDIHLHGACGYDFCDASPQAIKHITRYELSQGITTLFPTTMTTTSQKTLDILKAIYNFTLSPSSATAHIAGIYLEGPYISALQCGAQDINSCREPNLDEIKHFQQTAPGLITFLTLAPEYSYALEFIRACCNDTIISLGHTTANYDIAISAFKAGASHLTHCYNAMPPLHHREPGVIGAAMDCTDIYVELICDGLHLHPSTIRQAFKLFDDNHIIFISDSTMATGLLDGDYTLGGLPIHVNQGIARTPQGHLAGSTTHLMDCLKKAVSFGIPLEIALKCVTANPARESGIYNQVGSITSGKKADCVILYQHLNVIHVIQSGQLIF